MRDLVAAYGGELFWEDLLGDAVTGERPGFVDCELQVRSRARGSISIGVFFFIHRSSVRSLVEVVLVVLEKAHDNATACRVELKKS